jgi:threonyl-tRNA synthetase
MSDIENPHDHRNIGRDLDLFHIQEEGKGMVFWHQKGWLVYRALETYIRKKLDQHGYQEVNTPLLMDRVLWEKSGHWEKFKKNMFICETDEDEFLALKPMNCPSHIQIFNDRQKSYRDLPIRMAEFGSCHRFESSGGLHGLMRVRAFKQDDAHIFCREDQVVSEVADFIALLKEVYGDLGVKLGNVYLALRPETRAGTDEVWDKAEAQLAEASRLAGVEAIPVEGEGAFYGPKLEFHLEDSQGRSWQCGTIQLDFVLPQRLDASYINEQGEKQIPVMLHRAILGTFERFLGIYIEHCKGRFPLWMAPVQFSVLPIVTECNDYGHEVAAIFKEAGLRVEVDDRSETLNAKIRDKAVQKVPYLVIIGKRERNQRTVTIKAPGVSDEPESQWTRPLDDLPQWIKNNYGWIKKFQ